MQQPNDVFHLIGFAERDAALSTGPQQLKEKLEKTTPTPGVEPVEIYCLSPVVAALGLDKSLLAVYFYNEAAFKLSRQYNIKLPPEMKPITREKISDWKNGLTTFLLWPYQES